MIVLLLHSSLSEGGCMTNLLQELAMTPASAHRKLMGKIERYHQVIRRRFKIEDADQLKGDFKFALKNIQEMAPAFPDDEFLRWYSEHPYSNGELEAFSRNKTLIGDMLKEKADVFEKTLPQFSLKKVESELDLFLEGVRSSCRESMRCHLDRIGAWVQERFRRSCMGRNPEAIRHMISGFAFYNVSLLSGYAMKKSAAELENGFPYELVLKQTLMTPILGTVACRQNEARGLRVGEAVETKKPTTLVHNVTSYVGSKGSRFARHWLGYARWAPLEEASYLGFHILVQKAKGKEVDTDPNHIINKFGSLLVYDWAFAAPRNVIFIEPVFMHGLPGVRKRLERTVKNKIFSEVIFVPVDGMTRITFETAKSSMYRWYLNKLEPPKAAVEPEKKEK